MPFLRLTKGEFDHKFVGSLCILDYDLQLEQINCSFLMGSTRGQHFFASQNVLGTPGNKFSLSLLAITRRPNCLYWTSYWATCLARSRLDPIKVEYFLDLVSSPTFPQDVAYGIKSLKRSNGEKIEMPKVVRTVVASRLIQLCQSYWKEYGFAPQG